MGRHRRSGPAPGARRKQGAARVGLLGASAALTAGAVAIGTGLLPGSGDRSGPDEPTVQAHDSASSSADPEPSATADREAGASASRDGDRSGEPADESTDADETDEAAESARETAEESPSASPDASSPTAEEEPAGETSPTAPAAGAGSASPTEPTAGTTATPSDPTEEPARQAADEVLRLVNQERATAGCQPLTHDPALSSLATDFSRDMAERDFFSHDDPDGDTPWDRAEAAGVQNLAGENIARGQQDAQAVMDSWMTSEGHRANILNCDFRTLGVGVHLAPGGPWWTQNFGY